MSVPALQTEVAVREGKRGELVHMQRGTGPRGEEEISYNRNTY